MCWEGSGVTQEGQEGWGGPPGGTDGVGRLYRMAGRGEEALPEGQDWLRGPPEGLGWESPQEAGRGEEAHQVGGRGRADRVSPQEDHEDWEALQEGQEGLGGPPGEPGKVVSLSRGAEIDWEDVSGSLFRGLGGVGMGW